MNKGINGIEGEVKRFSASEPTAQHLTESSAKLIYLMTESVILKR